MTYPPSSFTTFFQTERSDPKGPLLYQFPTALYRAQ